VRHHGKKKRSPELELLQANFRLEVVFAGDPEGAAQPCWYGAEIDSPLNCEGRIIASHFLKSQRIGNALYALGVSAEKREEAEWDPRLAVPGCQAHDDRWDGHRMPPLVIHRHQVPVLVEAAATDWSLEEQVAHRCPAISSECCLSTQHPTDVSNDQGGTR
jgi:hypothetical protein